LKTSLCESACGVKNLESGAPSTIAICGKTLAVRSGIAPKACAKRAEKEAFGTLREKRPGG
jgi:hypothetical protein